MICSRVGTVKSPHVFVLFYILRHFIQENLSESSPEKVRLTSTTMEAI